MEKCKYMYRLKLGRSINFGEFFEKNISEAEENGFDTLDFDLTTFWHERDKEIELYKRIEQGLKRIEKSNLALNGVHISFGPNWDFSELNEEKRLAALRQTKEIFWRVDTAKPFCYIVHGSFEPIKAEERDAKLGQMKASMAELVSYTKAKVCLEDLPRTCLCSTAAELKAAIDEVAGLSACLDSNHFLKETPQSAVLTLGKRIKTLHISDYDFIDERHWLPLAGKIDWNAFLGALEATGYNGVFNYEVGTASAKEIKENYEKLFIMYNSRKS